MSSIRRIDLKDALRCVTSNADSPTFLSGWDETIADGSATEALQQRSYARTKSLTPHAMAHQSWIFGIEEEDNSDNPQPEWKIGWKTSLAPHRIHQVASNSSGTVIAATTVNGTVSIMRGSDGKVLATRKVVVNTEDKVPSFPLEVAPEVSFVRTSLPSSSGTETIVRDGILVHAPDQPVLLV